MTRVGAGYHMKAPIKLRFKYISRKSLIHENQYVRGNSQDCDQDQSNVVIQLGLTSKTCIVCHKVHYSGLSI